MSRDHTQRKRFLIVHNVLAGWGRHAILDQVRAHLVAAGVTVWIEVADGLEASRRLVVNAHDSGSFDVVVAAGGDSTIRGLADALAGTDLPLGIIPVGTGNVLAQEIGLTRRPRQIVDCLLNGPRVQAFPGLANGHRFFSMASAGFDVGVLKRLDIDWKRRIGKPAYIGPVLRELVHTPLRFEATVDGTTYPCTWLVVTKTAHYAGAFVIAPGQAPTLPGFHAVIVNATSRLAVAGVLVAAGCGLLARHPLVRIFPCREVTVPVGANVPLQIDGEPISGGASIEIRPDSTPLWLIVPTLRAADL